ncbi:TonB-dependent hemoglobin/transferrin/lactoferrin family receptor [Mesorhizobium sp.]|uniref:TonB-dependent hemoglobin/transferrin/lactoferrin family receptor n=2 Tax=Mesorhizobium sp. TaxID=1871066 RepID=UPI000FE6BE55|nr:MAG: TonB-dependent hemoglobin/transferrin/lactoferrin family receptor [Mesorhizobium sp.]RWK49484.1 MAG: TonB-dependent hemoglobin/transferrin/lactoferrin family receptor [Mesorhizobium sp.]RWK94850.1 MAG: TonB-dependent hemoglobin/transferrin/lactoferrin family receptor [Mesorhizobium sp.]TIQ29591.1 MAG: TonB-dependent hemoglobin/transferrin/lactoferrin family receptor [Mesorhizobium sp.]
MGLGNWRRLGLANSSPDPGHRSMAKGMAASLAGAAAIALLTPSANAQHTAQTATDQQQAEQAQTPEQPAAAGATLLDQILVVSRTGETAINSLASVSHVDQEQLQRRMATTPNDMLLGVPGVAVQADARRVSSSINIRGLQDFGRVAVIVDGARQNFQRSDHGPQSTFYIDPELIKSVDVIRGPVANTYGSGAIGGVVLFETKDADDYLRDGETWAASATGRYESNGEGWTTSAAGAYRFNENWDVLGNIVYRDYDDYKDGGGDTVDGTGFDVLSGLLKTTIRPSENSELKLGWNGTSDGWNEVSGGTPVNDVDLEANTFTARYNITDEDKSWLDLHINASYNKTNMEMTSLVAQNRFDPVTGLPIVLPAGSMSTFDVGTSGIDIWNTSRFETTGIAHELTYGGDWVGDDVETGGAAGGASFYTPSGKRNVSGAYIQDKLTWDWLEVIAGLRYDSYKLESDIGETSGDRLSPRITVGISPFETASLEGLQFYGTYAEGYRSPSLSETLISGNHPAGVSFPFLPNPDLKPEIGKTVEFGVNYKQDDILEAGDAFRFKAAYFNNDVDDYIDGVTLSAFDPTSGCPFGPGIPICFQYQNFAEAKIRGFEMEGVYDASWGFAGLSASIIDGHTISYDGERADLVTVPSSQVTGQLGFRFLEDKLTVGGEVQYNGKPKGNPVARDYTLVNAFASYQATDNLKVDFRADNLFDVKYTNPLNAPATSVVYEPGVTLKLAATMRFGG